MGGGLLLIPPDSSNYASIQFGKRIVLGSTLPPSLPPLILGDSDSHFYLLYMRNIVPQPWVQMGGENTAIITSFITPPPGTFTLLTHLFVDRYWDPNNVAPPPLSPP